MSGRPATVIRPLVRDCAFCRHSEARAIEGKRFAFVCKLERANMDAATCPDFKDSRAPSRNYNLPPT